MKDLTHYFASPPKSQENIEPITVINNLENPSGTTTPSLDKESNKSQESDTLMKAKRSRVKIRISLKDSKNNNNNRCDIIDSKNDVVDKTPSPFKKLNKNSRNEEEEEEEKQDNETLSNRNETPNAFKLLMNRNKAVTTVRDDTTSTPSLKDRKTKPKHSKEKPDASTERKRKLADIEDVELVEKRLEKRAKTLRRDEAEGKGDKKNKKQKKKNKKNKKANEEADDEEEEENRNENGKSSSKSFHNQDDKNSRNKNKKLTRESENGKDIRDCKEAQRVFKTNENLSTSLRQGELALKSKTKWSLRVKLQSYSDNDDTDCYERGGGEEEDKTVNGNTSPDEDYIFTPKSKVKFHKRRSRKLSSEGEAKEGKNESEKGDNKVGDIGVPDSLGSAKRGKHRITKIRKKLQTSINATEKIADVSVEILDVNLKELNNCPKILLEKKLAPLFVRRSKPNPAVVEARRSFLQSGIPETLKKIIIDQKPCCNDLGTPSMPFPKISHVSQWQTTQGLEAECSLQPLYKEKPEDNQQLAALSLDLRKIKLLSNFDVEIPKELRLLEGEKALQIERKNFETVLKDVESRCSDARKMWESISANLEGKKSPKKRGKKLKLQRKAADESPEHPNPTWTCKYKPISSSDVAGNEPAIAKLRNWLNGWRLPSPKDDYSSGDEFYSSECSSSSLYENNQVAVLLGPHGSGKTASVYAIAEELGYRVLEVNASSRRTGKKILTDFQEATKSHRVKRDQGTLLPTKEKPSDQKVPQNSLILIEDVDLIFEEDEGFISATFQLAANTRRPIVMTCKEACPYLNRMAPQQQFIHFQTAAGNRVSALLELIALAESGYRLPRSCLDVLLRNGDLRQSLLQLQYILLSGPPSVSQLGTTLDLTWADIKPLVYKPAIKSSRKYRKDSKDDKIIAKRDGELVETLANKLDNVSLISTLTELENPAAPPWRGKLKPSLSLMEDSRLYSNSDELSAEIADWLRLASLGSDQQIQNDSKSQLAIKRKVKLGIDLALSQAIPSTLEHRSTAVDYLPLLRSMCRSEEDRASINTKRGKRFHNYLHGLNLASASSNILAAASSVFRDKT